MEQYRGYRVNEVDPIQKIVSFTNGKSISVGEVVGDVSEKDIRRVQIRETIRSHFEKEKELYERGIKCLSLFFIDEVAKYRKYDEDGNEINSEYGDIFEQEYKSVLNDLLREYKLSHGLDSANAESVKSVMALASPNPCDNKNNTLDYEQYLMGIDVHATHKGYFFHRQK